MFHTQTYTGTREENYTLVIEQLKALISDEKNVVANLANASALLNYFLHDINWVGFYIAEGNELVLSRFKGYRLACAFRSAKGYVERPLLKSAQYVLPMFTRSQVISPATQRPNLKLSFP